MNISDDLSADNTTCQEWRMEQADRLLAWECLHHGMCAEKNLPLWAIAERTGLTTDEVRDMEELAVAHMKDLVKSVHSRLL